MQLFTLIPVVISFLLFIELLKLGIRCSGIVRCARSDGNIVEIKEGWSWPAFLFFWIWALIKRLWLIGSTLILIDIVLAYFLINQLLNNEAHLVLIYLTLILRSIIGWNGNAWLVNQLIRNGFKVESRTPPKWRFFKNAKNTFPGLNRMSSLTLAISLMFFLMMVTVLSDQAKTVSWQVTVIIGMVPALAMLLKSFLYPTFFQSMCVAAGGYVGGLFLSLMYMDTTDNMLFAVIAVLLLFIGYLPSNALASIKVLTKHSS